MEIAFINNNYQLGGAETVVRQLHQGCLKAGVRSTLFVANGKTYPRDADVQPLYPRILSYLYHSRLHRPVDRWFNRAQWTDASFARLAQTSADVIHLHSFHGDYASIDSLAALARKKPVVWTFHAFWGITGGCDHPGACRRYLEACGECPRLGEWGVGPVDRTAAQLQKKRTHLADAPISIIAPSRHLAKTVQESLVGRGWQIHHIPNGVDPERFGFARKRDPEFRKSLGVGAHSTIILVVNRDFQDPVKGFPMVERALSTLDPTGVEVVFIGQNAAWAIARVPPQLRCHDVGYINSRDRLADWYEAADVFLFASPAENFPCVILEAMAAKCCVVSTPTSGVVEQVNHGVTGFLAEEMDGASLGQALADALADDERRVAVGERAREVVCQEFSETTMVNRHLRLYESLGK